MLLRRSVLISVMIVAAVPRLSAADAAAVPRANFARPLEIARVAASAAAFKSSALVVGGRLKGYALREAAAQDPVTWEWKAIEPMRVARAEFGLAEADGVLYAVGGAGDDRHARPFGSVEKLERLDGDWSAAPSLAQPRRAHGVAALDGVVYACGGVGKKGVLASCEKYIPGVDEWSSSGSMPEPRWNFGMSAVAGRLYAVGGSTTAAAWSPSDEMLVRDSAGSWSRGPKLPKPLYQPAVASLGGRLYVVSGYGLGGVNNTDTYEFDPAANRWRTSASVGSLRDAAALAWQGQIYVLGGTIDGRTANSRAASFDPAAYAATGKMGASFVTLGGETDWIVEDGLVRMGGKANGIQAATRRRKPCPSDVALVIGVERYRRAPAVRFAQDDASAFFETAVSLGVPAARARLIVGKDASLPGLRKNIEEWLPSLAESDSRVIVYFSGAGTLDLKSGRRFLMPSDGNPEFVDATAYPLDRLFDSLRQLPAREILVVLDAGFSGTGERSIFPTGLRPLVPVRGDPPDHRISVIMAGGDHDAVWSSADLKGGAFTFHLVEALGGRADADHDGLLTLEEAFVYTRRKVGASTISAASLQTPTLTTSHAGARLY